MNWIKLLSDLRAVMTLEQIAAAVGLSSRGAVHGIATGKQRNVTYEVGVAIIKLHKRITKPKARKGTK